jgi:hypothetical protein
MWDGRVAHAARLGDPLHPGGTAQECPRHRLAEQKGDGFTNFGTLIRNAESLQPSSLTRPLLRRGVRFLHGLAKTHVEGDHRPRVSDTSRIALLSTGRQRSAVETGVPSGSSIPIRSFSRRPFFLGMAFVVTPDAPETNGS